jgi:hypothetical protein
VEVALLVEVVEVLLLSCTYQTLTEEAFVKSLVAAVAAVVEKVVVVLDMVVLVDKTVLVDHVVQVAVVAVHSRQQMLLVVEDQVVTALEAVEEAAVGTLETVVVHQDVTVMEQVEQEVDPLGLDMISKVMLPYGMVTMELLETVEKD